jgi:hypothetical protein
VRLSIVDGFRGFFLLFMGVAHFNSELETTLGKFNHHHLGWVEDAQGFVFISGLIVGLVYGRKFLKTSTLREAFAPVIARCKTIYLHQAGLILILLAAALLLGPYAPTQLLPYQETPASFTLTSLLLVSASMHMGILPMYIAFLLLTPLAFRMLQRDWVFPFALLVLLGWTFAQTGLSEELRDRLVAALAARGVTVELGIYFHPLAWQALFFAGLYFGFEKARDRLDLGFLGQEQYRVGFFIALGATVFLAVFDRIVGWDLFGHAYTAAVEGRTERAWLAWIYPPAFFIALFMTVWLLGPGRRDANRLVAATGRLTEWVFTRRPLVFLGQHSLHVFSWHILVTYALATLVQNVPLGEAARSAILIVSVASLFLAAQAHVWMQRRDARRSVGYAGG